MVVFGNNGPLLCQSSKEGGFGGWPWAPLLAVQRKVSTREQSLRQNYLRPALDSKHSGGEWL